MELTVTQEKAITYDGRNLQLIACAGSGKTEVVARRVVQLLSPDGQALLPRNIIAFTFTDKAAAELKERIVTRTREALGDIAGMAEMFVGTIHAFCLELLKSESPRYLKYEVLNEVQQTLFVDRHSRASGLTQSTTLTGQSLKRYTDTRHFITALNILREDRPVAPHLLAGNTVMAQLPHYEQLLHDRGYLDYSSILKETVAELKSNQGLRERLAVRIRHVIVDEYQDVNPVQESVVEELHRLGAGVCVVGDDDQTIYQWRGSDVRNILSFEDRYPGATQVRLEENFRSSEGVVAVARDFIRQVVRRLPKEMKTTGAQEYGPGDITALPFDAPEDEARHVARTCRALRGVAIHEDGRERGISWSDMAVLLRSVRRDGEAIIAAMDEAGVPYVITGMDNLFQTDEAEAARQLFYFLANEIDDVALRTVWRTADLGIDTDALDRAVAEAVRARQDMGEAEVGQFKVYNLQRQFIAFLENVGLREERVPGRRGEVVFYNLGKFSQAISDFESIHFHSNPVEKYASFAGFLRHHAESAYPEGWQDNAFVSPDAVRIMTVHQSKGLQWPVVFIPQLVRNRFPSRVGGAAPPGTLTEVMRYATAPIVTLAAGWRETLATWQDHFRRGNRRDDVPPVFIIVCKDTTIAKALYAWLAEGDAQHGAGVPEFRNTSGSEMTVRIDSKVGEDIAAGGTSDETRRLRFVLETIGKTEWPGRKVPEEYAAITERHNRKAMEDEDSGLVALNPNVPPGRDVRCIISVSMLSEGWDATTVTHVIGLRPFGSQLLCEQVVGRALRRTSYTVEPDSGLFTEETAQIFGVPFELIPFKVEGGKPQPPNPPANHVYAVPEKAEYEIEFPVVESYQDPGIVQVKVNWDRVGELVLDPDDVPDDVLLRGLAASDGRLIAYGPGAPVRVSLEAWRRGVRVQQVAFDLAKVLIRKWQEDRGDAIPVHRLFPQMLDAANRFISEHVTPVKSRTTQDLAINPYFGKAIAMMGNAMEIVDGGGASRERAVFAPGAAGVRSTRVVNFHTGKELHDVQRCHLNAAVFDMDWERQAGELLGSHLAVAAWVKNDRLGLVIPYRKEGTPRKYLPDFVVELKNGGRLIVEIKGQAGDAAIKKAAAERWCRAVNNDGRHGNWAYHLCFGAAELKHVLDTTESVAGPLSAAST